MSSQAEQGYKYEARLVELALRLFFAAGTPQQWDGLRPTLTQLIRDAYIHLDPHQRKLLRSVSLRMIATPPRAPPYLVELLRYALGVIGLIFWVSTAHPWLFGKMGVAALHRMFSAWLKSQPQALQHEVLESGIRYRTHLVTATDQKRIATALEQLLSSKEEPMATFQIDPRGLPSGFDAAKFIQAVEGELSANLGIAKTTENEVIYAAIIGMLLLEEQFDPSAFGFADAIQKAWLELLGKTKDTQGNVVPNRDIYKKISEIIPTLPGRTQVIFYQEFSSVGRHAIAAADEVPIDHPNFATQVRLGVDNYVAGQPPFESLELPPLTGPDGSDVEIETDNIKAVALIYAAYQLEQVRLFHVVDRITEIFMNGMLPLGFDAGGKALDIYYWDSHERMNEAARYMQYGRVLGARGGDVSREVQPNTEFEGLWLRFLASLSEFDRQQRVADLLDSRRRSLAMSGEHVRKAGRDLAANVSLYGWGGTHFAARRLNSHIATAIDILKLPQIQKAYGVSNPWQVVERVAAAEFGQAPNVVRYRTMADAGKRILDLIAKYAKVWSGSSGKPLFNDITQFVTLTTGTTLTQTSADFSQIDQADLMRQTEYWLAVNGIKDEQVDQYSQPVESTIAPSLPSFSNISGNGHGNGTMDQLRQMVAQGQTPSLEQLQQMLPIAGVGV